MISCTQFSYDVLKFCLCCDLSIEFKFLVVFPLKPLKRKQIFFT